VGKGKKEKAGRLNPQKVGMREMEGRIKKESDGMCRGDPQTDWDRA